MAKEIKQIRYFGENSSLNQIQNTQIQIDGSNRKYLVVEQPIYQIGIQALPGTPVYINDNTIPIIIGQYGNYSLDLIGNGTSLNKIMIDITNYYFSMGSGIIIDIICEQEEA